MIRSLLFILFVLGSLSCSNNRHEDLIGKKAPELEIDVWVGGRLDSLGQKATLVRWWTDGCSYCRNTSSALNYFDETYRDDGLQVLGLYHPKPITRRVSTRDVYAMSKELAFNFPIGIDKNWKNLKNFWLDQVDNGWTSVSFLIDSRGEIVHIHPGGEYHRSDEDAHHQCQVDFNLMEVKIKETLLK